MATYSIKDLEYLSGIKAHTIRIWEKRYSLLNPNRTTTNIRAYSGTDVRRLLNVSALIKNGYKISIVANMSEESLHAEVLKISLQFNSINNLIDQLILYAINFRSNDFEAFFDKIVAENGFEVTIQKVIFPFLEMIGTLWQTGSIFSAHEHFISNLIRDRIIIETQNTQNQITITRAIFYLPEGEFHEIGLLYFRYLAKKIGISGIYLGQSLPYVDLTNLISKSSFDYVFTCFVQAIRKPELEKYINELSVFFRDSKIFIAGRQLSIHNPILPSNVSAIKSNEEFNDKVEKD